MEAVLGYSNFLVLLKACGEFLDFTASSEVLMKLSKSKLPFSVFALNCLVKEFIACTL